MAVKFDARRFHGRPVPGYECDACRRSIPTYAGGLREWDGDDGHRHARERRVCPQCIRAIVDNPPPGTFDERYPRHG